MIRYLSGLFAQNDIILCKIHLQIRSVVDIHYAVAVGVGGKESVARKGQELGDMLLDRGYVADIHPAVAVGITGQELFLFPPAMPGVPILPGS